MYNGYSLYFHLDLPHILNSDFNWVLYKPMKNAAIFAAK